MNKFKTTLPLLVLIAAVIFTGCKKDDGIKKNISVVTAALQAPQGLSSVKIKTATITYKEINTGWTNNAAELKAGNTIELELPKGSYDVTVEGEIEYVEDGTTKTTKVRGLQSGLNVVDATTAYNIVLYVYNENANFVIKEIFFTGTQTPEGKTYNGDKYVIIHNNSDKVLYADGLIFAESDFLTTTKRVYTPDVLNEAFTTKTIVMVPGSGTEYPVQPGESFTIANNAINHLEYNANSADLSKSKFEVELLSSINVDNPQVPNTINFSAFLTMHNRGFKSYILGKLDKTKDQFLAQNGYTYGYVNSAGNITNTQSYKVPNANILDAVNLSVQAVFEWIVTSPSLDMGWTYCGKVDSDATRFGKSVIRKILTVTPDGRTIYKDTNNSTVDFTPETKASLIK